MICRRTPPHAKFIFSAAYVFAFSTLAGVAAAAEVAAMRLDGAAVNGQLREWDNDHVLIATPTGDQRLATDRLASLHWQPASGLPTVPDKSPAIVELIDGSILPIQSISIEKSQAKLTLVGPASSADKSLTLPTTQVAVVQFRQLDEALADQWEEVRRLNAASDVVAVLKKDGKSLDYVEGVVGNVSEDKIDFKLEGEPQRVDRAKIAGIVYFRPDRRLKDEPRAIIHGHSRLRLSATRIELKDSRLNVITACGAELTWPLDDLTAADFSAGKVMYLSDVEPASTNWTPLVGLPAAAKLAANYGQPRRDKSAYGGPLALLVKEGDAATAQSTARTFKKGLALRSRTEIVYRLPAGFQRFIAQAGIDPTTIASGNVRLVISGDDRVLLETEIAGDKSLQPIQLDIAGVKRLKIVVDYGQNLDTGDWLNLCDARIVK